MFGDITGWLVAFKYPASDSGPQWLEVKQPEREEALALARQLAAQRWPEADVCKVVPIME
ncbi:hypothetical protein [Eleftheria terrae]|uniref:hypothetical protein n=1 Tax=Eleftheria terrae TaxID=1597781 RepID=UPI00263B395D|nr:hypothetical protein [Eleftheria terrae]WKB53488.1 hypothetical protein N7L95_03560 [Eleftheria terrae]